MRHNTWLCLASCLWLGSVPLTASHAQEPAEDPKALADALFEGFPIDDEQPESKLPTPAQRDAHPVQFGFWLMNLTEKAEERTQRGDHAGAARYYRALAAAVPDEAVSLRKLCSAYEQAGDRNKAEVACGAALLRNGALISDYSEYVRLVVAQKEPLSDKQLQHVDEAVTYLRGKFPESAVSAQLACQLALRLKDQQRLSQCSAELQKRDPRDMAGITYSWLLAVMRLDRGAANNMLESARTAGADAKVLKGMEIATITLRSPLQQLAHSYGRWAVIGLVVMLLGLYAATRKSNVKLR